MGTLGRETERKSAGRSGAGNRSGMQGRTVPVFRRRLMSWYRSHARELPWRGINDPYRTWVSEIMLQQTRVAAVVEHYNEFLQQFPTILALALAPEAAGAGGVVGPGVLPAGADAAQGGAVYYAGAGGKLPTTAVGLRTLPGIGEYTAAAIASIAFGESIAVVDGNVERVMLRVTGRPMKQGRRRGGRSCRRRPVPLVPRRSVEDGANAAGDHNQAMMELGATVCLPREPLCLECPVYSTMQDAGGAYYAGASGAEELAGCLSSESAKAGDGERRCCCGSAQRMRA